MNWMFSAEREIEWIARRHNNAILIKDLRSHLRRTSLRGNLVKSCIILLIVWKLVQAFPGALAGLRGIWWQFAFTFLIAPGSIAMSAWQKEARGATLEMLLLSPLRSDEILRGRLWAALLCSTATQLPFLCFIAWLIIQASLGRLAGAAPSAIACFPLFTAWIIWNSGAVPASNAATEPGSGRRGESSETNQGCATLIGLSMMFLLSMVPVFALSDYPLFAWLLGLLLWAVNTGVATLCFRRRVAMMDERRLIKSLAARG
jgi:hypothetical protein